jgi:hypothetical protein
MRVVARIKAEFYKDVILSSAYWKVVQQAVALCSPIYNLWRIADGETTITGRQPAALQLPTTQLFPLQGSDRRSGNHAGTRLTTSLIMLDTALILSTWLTGQPDAYL